MGHPLEPSHPRGAAFPSEDACLDFCILSGLCYRYRVPYLVFQLGSGGSNRNSPHRLKCLNAWPVRSGTVRRHDLVGGSVPLWRQA